SFAPTDEPGDCRAPAEGHHGRGRPVPHHGHRPGAHARGPDRRAGHRHQASAHSDATRRGHRGPGVETDARARASFKHAAGPTKPIIGVVRDKDTKKPLAGATIQSYKLASSPMHGIDFIKTTTDEHGRYRL